MDNPERPRSEPRPQLTPEQTAVMDYLKSRPNWQNEIEPSLFTSKYTETDMPNLEAALALFPDPQGKLRIMERITRTKNYVTSKGIVDKFGDRGSIRNAWKVEVQNELRGQADPDEETPEILAFNDLETYGPLAPNAMNRMTSNINLLASSLENLANQMQNNPKQTEFLLQKAAGMRGMVNLIKPITAPKTPPESLTMDELESYREASDYHLYTNDQKREFVHYVQLCGLSALEAFAEAGNFNSQNQTPPSNT